MLQPSIGDYFNLREADTMKVQRVVFFMLVWVCGWNQVLVQVPPAAAEDGGLGGEITIGVAHIFGRPSQLEVGDDNDRLEALDERADRETYNEAYLAGELHYTLAPLGTTLFLDGENGSTELAAGVTQHLGDAGQLTVAALYGIDEVWKDPYLTGVKREATDVETYGLTLAYEEIFGTGAFVSSTVQMVDVDRDEIGDREKRLRRDGARSGISVGYQLALGDSARLTPTLRIESQDIRGEANASDGVEAGLTYGWQQGQWLLDATAAVGYSEHRKAHPVFHKTRKAITYAGSALVGYTAPFGWSAITLYALASYVRTDENITFFDGDTWVTGVGVGVAF
jgi:hypothetical protein